jgi:hypothetical protein
MIPEILNSFALTLDFLRAMVQDVEEAKMTAQPSGVVNHPAWVIGHLAYSCQAMAGELGLAPWLPPWWSSRFGTGSTPVDDRTAYPAKDELLTALDEGQRRIVAVLSAKSEAEFAGLLPDLRHRERFPTLGHAIVHILGSHAAIHVGQVTVWRRVMKMARLKEPFV